MIWSWPPRAYSGAEAGGTTITARLYPLFRVRRGLEEAKSMRPKRAQERQAKSAGQGYPPARSALPGRGGLARIAAAFWNSLRGLQEGLSTESAIKQEVAIACLLLPLSVFIVRDLWTW